MDEATQSLTQPYEDPRREGLNNSGLNDQDVSDVICILHPSSIYAHTAVATTACRNPQHILQKDDLDYVPTNPPLINSNRDIALRMSSPVKDLRMGFCFGRNMNVSDILLTPDDSEKKVSNTHFRIYLTDDGIVMLQDTSTNGTLVNDAPVRKGRRGGVPETQMLMPGSIIFVRIHGQSEGIKFIVRIPSREGHRDQYFRNLQGYLDRVRQAKGEVDGQIGNGRTRSKSRMIVTQEAGEAYGMHWNGAPLYNVTGQIGKGAFATVYKLATKNDGAIFACKELDKRRLMKNNVSDHKVDNEMRIMSGLNHPNIVQFIDYFEYDKRWIYIIMEYVPGGELSTHLLHNRRLPEDMVRTIARQVLHALQYLHRRKITHRDIKPDNILISSFDPLHVKLSDFGLSKVVQEETFLKTFCGTLLYCAPEVYPDYDNYRRGEGRKRRRLRDPVPRTSPYDQSVDMWSFGAVLFHILSGTPPYTGRGDDRGAQMLRNIMTADADFSLLRAVGVSENGIDFIAKLLDREPTARPNEKECFRHPWIVDLPDVLDYMDVDEGGMDEYDSSLGVVEEVEENEDLGASNLRIHDEIDEASSHELEDIEAEIKGHTKRQRLAPNSSTEQQPTTTAQEIKYPSLPSLGSYDINPSIHIEGVPQTGPRLFGEITNSALRSSGALGQHFQPHPNASESGDQYEMVDESDFSSSSQQSMASWPTVHHSDTNDNRKSQESLGHGASAPSLLGAESLMGNFHVESPDGRSPDATTPNSGNPTTPEAGAERDAEPTTNGSETKEAEGRSKVEGQQGGHGEKAGDPPVATANGTSQALQGDPIPKTTYETISSANQQLLAELASTIDEKTGKEVSHALNDNGAPEAPLSSSRTISAGKTSDQFVKPPLLLGKLVTVPGSIVDTTLRLESRLTSWGRGPRATIRHSDKMDTRIPAYALEITFRAPSVEHYLENGNNDWMNAPDLMTILSTKASRCIWVNDVELRRESPSKDALLFGKLYTGDIITVYRHRDQYLRFRCEFYFGDSAKMRPDSEKGFIIEQARLVSSQSGRESAYKKTIQGVPVTTTGSEAYSADTTVPDRPKK